jgi:hypothetical protein
VANQAIEPGTFIDVVTSPLLRRTPRQEYGFAGGLKRESIMRLLAGIYTLALASSMVALAGHAAVAAEGAASALAGPPAAAAHGCPHQGGMDRSSMHGKGGGDCDDTDRACMHGGHDQDCDMAKPSDSSVQQPAQGVRESPTLQSTGQTTIKK